MQPSSERRSRSEDPLSIDARRQLLRVRERAWGIAFGLTCGVLLGVATLVLVVRGGSNVGAHLGLLSVFLPGYSVTYFGSAIGFTYAFVIGTVLGWLTGRLYHLFARTP